MKHHPKPILAPLFSTSSQTAFVKDTHSNAGLIACALIKAAAAGEDLYGHEVAKHARISAISTNPNTAAFLKDSLRDEIFGGSLSVSEFFYGPSLNLLSAEGVALLRSGRSLHSEDLLVVEITSLGPRKRVEADALRALVLGLTDTCKAIVVLLTLPPKERDILPSIFREAFELDACEPDQGFASAMTFLPLRGTLRASVGEPGSLVNFRCDSSSTEVEEVASPFVSRDAKTRHIVTLRMAGSTLEAIGDAIGMTKGGVLRRLDKLPLTLRPPSF